MKSALVIIDYQNDFVDGSLGFKGAETLYEPILDLFLKFKEEGNDIIFTKDIHGDDYFTYPEGKSLPIEHCKKGSNGAKLYKSLEELSKGYPVIEKDVFGSLELANMLKEKNYDVVHFVGLVSNICVFSNALFARCALPKARIVVHRNMTGSHDLVMQEKSFDLLKSLNVDVI